MAKWNLTENGSNLALSLNLKYEKINENNKHHRRERRESHNETKPSKLIVMKISKKWPKYQWRKWSSIEGVAQWKFEEEEIWRNRENLNIRNEMIYEEKSVENEEK